MSDLKQRIRFESFAGKSLPELLQLPGPVFEQDDPYRQLRYVEQYVREPKLGAQSLVIEEHYVDRDYMDDHSVFYAKSFAAIPNYCRRLHFFRSSANVVRNRFLELISLTDPAELKAKSEAFSKDEYLGFSVIKPLLGCPVGRTVLRVYPPLSDDGSRRCFSCACNYTVHLLGVRLEISGLAFQQQDLGVSACATTALWSSLQRTRAMDKGGPATPAQITTRASQHALPFGRPMPSEGLSLDQMCQAIHSLGYAPNLIRSDDCREARGVLYSAIASGTSPVLVLSNQNEERHAVAVSGMKLGAEHRQYAVTKAMDDIAGDLLALYIHDDRHGPYLLAELQNIDNRLSLQIALRENRPSEIWILSHILVPVHSKIRLSFGELRRIAFRVTAKLAAHLAAFSITPVPALTECTVVKSHEYLASKIISTNRFATALIEKLCTTIPLPRYIGVIVMRSPELDPLEMLVDTTSTERNLNFIALIQTENNFQITREIAQSLSTIHRCPLLF